jgi:hypothetical protein
LDQKPGTRKRLLEEWKVRKLKFLRPLMDTSRRELLNEIPRDKFGESNI